MRRLLNIRYIKLWNLFLLNGIEKSKVHKNIYIYNKIIQKIKNGKLIYIIFGYIKIIIGLIIYINKVVNKLLSIAKEGQLYSKKYQNILVIIMII